MAINIKGAAALGSPHGEAALKMGDPTPGDAPVEEASAEEAQPEQVEQIEQAASEEEGQQALTASLTATSSQSKDGELLAQNALPTEHTDAGVLAVNQKPAVVKVSFSFRFPIADYTMLGFEVGVEYPCDPGDVDSAYVAAKEWAEERLNSLIADQQSAQG